ncbi:hypothetical protein [Erwinia typographi]|uniref:hypothetical protein n=1 Tax=Erwinia typographi TaxID=371042 RepID=UPI0012ED970E|nr:hypothetical protein [Erwinia typographi]
MKLPLSGTGGHVPASSTSSADLVAQHQPVSNASSSSHSVSARPGNGISRVHGQQVAMTALNQSGQMSAFRTGNTRRIESRGQMPINPARAQELLADEQRLSHAAEQMMAAITQNDLNHFPPQKIALDQQSRAHMLATSPAHRQGIREALDFYQSKSGDNVLMNISRMGYQTLPEFLKACDNDYHDDDNIDDFVENFGLKYSVLNEVEDSDDEEEVEDYEDDKAALKSRIEDTLSGPSQTLDAHLSQAPRIHNTPLLKGATGGDNLDSTQVNGNALLKSVLEGKAIRFNGFLSTSAEFKQAIDFCGRTERSVLGKPIMTIDLNSDAPEQEVLRRHALQLLERGQCDTGSILYHMEAQGAAGVSLNATKQENSAGHLDHEDEILMASQHYRACT